MEKHRCRLCFKSFVNGRALGGHMRSHLLSAPIPSKLQQPSQDSEAASASASYSSDEEQADKNAQFYGLRENPKRSVRMGDPEFVDAASVVLQDRESETESSKNPTRRRSKRTRKILDQQQDDDEEEEEEETKMLKVNINQLSKTESWAEPEPVSSISDTTTEEDVAFCLMMLSRDQWKSKVNNNDEEDEEEEDDDDDEEEEEEEEETDESEGYLKISKVNNRTARAKYRCETCNKVFKSYQALGGHRASHKKIKAYSQETELKAENVATCSMTEKKIHECPVCFRVFSSGQALGGHKRSHVVATTKTAIKSSKKLGDGLIDLNLPAPIDDDDASQIELSAVSDAEFVK
ncbi:hypothetical protein V6N13_128541 [Hibiscus sabdariffa]|uniref:C2H2-type domain-containing protein n=1 Tax=Hibiscus sabdariffa TaxID=183260 RepID=A0ABR2P137_9ROSI